MSGYCTPTKTWRVLPGSYRLGMSFFYFMFGVVFASWASRIPDIQARLALSDAMLGLVLFALPVGQMLMMPFSGYLVSRWGGWPVFNISSVLYPLSLLGAGLAPTGSFLALALLGMGIAGNMNNISLNTQACAVETLYGRSIMGTFHGVWSLGGFTGGILGAILAGVGWTSLAHFGFVIVLSFLLIGMGRQSLFAPGLPSLEPRGVAKKKVTIRPDRYLLLLGSIAFCCMFAEGTMYDWSSVYFASVVKPDERWIRLGYIASMGAMTTGRFLTDLWVSRLGAKRVLRMCGTLIAAGLLLATLCPQLVPATLGFLLVGIGVSAVIPICYSLAGHSPTIQASIALTMVSSIGFFGFLVGPPLIGLISEWTHLRWALGGVALLGGMIVVLTPGTIGCDRE
ncbi:MAG: MFS transporter [Planctomycetia bacterium]|nr:MFS transporter [Planctomycetia bacterium]